MFRPTNKAAVQQKSAKMEVGIADDQVKILFNPMSTDIHETAGCQPLLDVTGVNSFGQTIFEVPHIPDYSCVVKPRLTYSITPSHVYISLLPSVQEIFIKYIRILRSIQTYRICVRLQFQIQLVRLY